MAYINYELKEMQTTIRNEKYRAKRFKKYITSSNCSNICSDHFRSIAIRSILSKILDYIIIDQQAHSLITSDHQFGFKPNSSTVLCTTMLVETVQYYDENGRQPVYVLQLDASKAFDRVSYRRLFNVLLKKNVCPYIVRLLCYMC